MKNILFIILLSPAFAQAQTFFVSGQDPKSVDVVERKIAFEGYTVSKDSANSQYIVHLLLDGSYRLTLKKPFAGYIKIVEAGTGSEVGRTKVKKTNPAALNGFNASYGIFSALSRKYLADELKKCKKA